MNNKQQLLTQQLEALRLAYAQELPNKIAALKVDWQQLKLQPTEQTLAELKCKIHNLIGSGATFGFAEVSKAAHALDAALNSYSHDPHIEAAIDPLLADLESAANVEHDNETEIPLFLPKNYDSFNHCPRVLLISDNVARNNEMCVQLGHYGIHSEMLGAAQALLARIEATRPHTILFEMTASAEADAMLDKISQVKRSLLQAPAFIVISPHSDMASRLKAVRAGATAYMLSPVNMTELVDFIRLRHRLIIEPTFRILIVDDDVALAHNTALILQRAGLETHVVTDPMTVLEALNDFQPELVLLDLYMPTCTGLELTAVIRQQCAYTGTGIVFFSVETDINRHIDAMREGGDEFFVKSMAPKNLVAAVEAKAKRARTIQRLMFRDGLTGLLNRASFYNHLQREITKSKRRPSVFSYVMLDLDHFKSINDRFGHLAGDHVLKSLGLLLGQRLRAVDIAGRYGGEELVILLPGASAMQAERIIGKLLQTFSAFKFYGCGGEFSATFSAGIAEYPCFENLTRLAEAADQALYRAKAEGRNRICLALV
jgi:diguanylate cyclase (GGDEF)-like protein